MTISFAAEMGLILHLYHDPVTKYLLITLNNNFTCMTFYVGMAAKAQSSFFVILQLVLGDTCTEKSLCNKS